MSKFIENFQTYEQIYKKLKIKFDHKNPIPGGKIKIDENTELPERGLGNILAIATFISDVDVIGGKGGNVGFIIEEDNGNLFATTVKIDPGSSFDKNKDKKPSGKSIHVATGYSGEEGEIEFEKLPIHTQKEFLMTLHEIIQTNPATIPGFFSRKGGHNFILNYQPSVAELSTMIIDRQQELKKIYEKELKDSIIE